MLIFLTIIVYAFIFTSTDGSHFLGGTITWRPLNASATGSPVAIVITQTTSWNYTSVKCNNSAISNGWPVSNVGSLAPVRLQCIDNCGSGSTGYPSNISVTPICTGFSAPVGTTVGQRSDIVYLASGDDFSAAFMLGAWRTLATVIGANWSLAVSINTKPRSDNGLYNSAPVATVMSPISIPYNQTFVINIPVADADGDTLRCRWANNSNGINECGGVCPPDSLPPNTVIYPNCTIIIKGLNISDWYAVAIVVEDFINSTSTTSLSSVPVQFLIQVVPPITCTISPEIIGIPDEQSCTPLAVNQTFTSKLIAINHCGSNVTIIDIAMLPFAGVIQGNITKLNSTTYSKSFTWTASTSNLGYQVMCAMAVDSESSQSSQYCFKFYVSQTVASDCPGETTSTTTVSTTAVATTVAPTTVAPTTAAPTTVAPTTAAATTVAPTTVAPTTAAATTVAPTTVAPTTVVITTAAVTTAAATTVATTTVAPTTVAPTTVAPTTVAPTTVAPTTAAATTVAVTTAVVTTAAITTEITTVSNSTMTDITSAITSIIPSTNIVSTFISTVLPSTTSITSIPASSTSSTLGSTTTSEKKSDPINWPLIGTISALLLLAALALCCCLCWCFLCPFAARSYSYSDASPVLYHIERCTDPNCDWSNRSSSSNISLSSSRNYLVHTSFDDRPTDTYIKLRSLSSVATTNTDINSEMSSFPRSRLSSLPESFISMQKGARVSISTIRVNQKMHTIGNPGIKPPILGIHERKKDTSSNLGNIKVSRVSWSEKPRISSIRHELTRNSICPLASDQKNQSRNSVQVTRVSFVSSNSTCQSTMNDTSLPNCENTIYLDNSDKTGKSSPTVNITGLRFKHSFSESTSSEKNDLSHINQSGLLPITLKSKSITPAHNHIRVRRLSRTMKKTNSRNSLPLASVTGMVSKMSGTRVQRISRKSTT